MSRYNRNPIDYFPIVPGEPLLLRADELYVGGAGTVIVPTPRGIDVVFNVPAGTNLEIELGVALKAESTATGIVGLRYADGGSVLVPRDPTDPTDPDEPDNPDNPGDPTDPVEPDPLPPFPDAMDAEDWAVSEVRDPALAASGGFQEVTVNLTAPEGFRLFVYAGNRDDVTGLWDRVTRHDGAGSIFRTPVGLATGSRVYPQAFWQRTQDGAWQSAGSLPSYLVQGLLPVVELTDPVITTAGGSATTSTIQPSPSGILTPGRLLVALVGTGIASAPAFVPTVAGWTKVDEMVNGSGRSEIYYRVIQTLNENVGEFTGGRPRFIVVDDFDPAAPIRQAEVATATTGATHTYPALPTPLLDNSAVVSFGFATTTVEGKAPGVRSDSTLIYQRTTASGLHATVAVSTAIPAGTDGAIWPAQEVPTSDGLSAGGWHAWSIEIAGGEGAEVIGEDAAFRTALTPTVAELSGVLADAPMAFSIPALAGNGEGNPSTPLYARHKDLVIGMAARAGFTAVLDSAGLGGNRTAAQHAVWTLRWYLNSTTGKGRAPAARAGYHAQYEVMLIGLICTAVVTPEIWNELTTTEREKCDLLMLGFAVANAAVGSDHSPFTGDWMSRRTIRGYTAGRNNVPNFSSPTRLIPHVVKRYFQLRGGDSLQTRFNTFNRPAFAARLAPTSVTTVVDGVSITGIGGLDWAYDTFRFPQWTNAVKEQMHTPPASGVGPGPTTAQIQAMLNGNGTGNYSCFSKTLSDAHTIEVFADEIERVLSLPCAPGVLNQEGGVINQEGWTGRYGINNASTGNILRGCITPGRWANIPHKGLIGMPMEIDTTDEGPRRSSMSYAFAGVSAVFALTAAMVTMKAFSLNDTDFADARVRMVRGWDWIKYAINNTFRSYAKGGGNMSNNEDFSLAYVDANRAQRVYTPAWDYLIRAVTTA